MCRDLSKLHLDEHVEPGSLRDRLLENWRKFFCGFIRRTGQGPTPYPVACALQASLGLSVHAAQQRVVFERPTLPDFLQEVRLTKLQVGDSTVDLLLEHHTENVGIEVLVIG